MEQNEAEYVGPCKPHYGCGSLCSERWEAIEEEFNGKKHRAVEKITSELEKFALLQCGECTGGHCMRVMLGKGVIGSGSGKT